MLFSWLQGADFYRDLHRQAVACLPHGAGSQWIDMGCGPGLVARLAAARGYAATGVDSSAGMVRAARLLARWQGSAARFQCGDLAALPLQAAEIRRSSLLDGLVGAWILCKPD
jgi:ubiquinone/menaquinone biosynthesis C-methylase UbiE